MVRKFKVGEKVRVSDKILEQATFDQMKKFAGKIVTISYVGIYFDEYSIKEDDETYAWKSGWLEPLERETVTFSFSACSKEEALKIAKKEIEKAFPPKDWTDTDITIARDLTAFLVSKAVKDGGEITFSKQGKTIVCCFYENSFSVSHAIAEAKPHGSDVPNDWIGKCVAVCKVMHEPVPKFIYNKNR